MSYQTVLERLSQWAVEQPDKKVWTFLDDKGEFVEDYSYKELETATDNLAEYLLGSAFLKRGDRVLLVFFPGLDFTAALIACFKAGLIAVPVFPPDPRKLKKDLHHFVSIQKSCTATIALTNAQFNFVKRVEDIKNFFSNISWPVLKWIEIEDYLKKGKKKALLPSSVRTYPPNESVAFLQYTSGSTSEPKGVMISHGNLGHNLTLITTVGEAVQSSVCVSWLPQYHDMGLIGTYLGILYAGGRGYFLSPISFLKDPLVWVRTLSRYGGTHSPSPNFAYALVVRKFKEGRDEARNQNLDLRTAISLINAAEPVDFRAVREFYETFAPFGLPGRCVQPTYGLAEHTVFVCSKGTLVLTVKKAALEQGSVDIVHEELLHFDAGASTSVVTTADGNGTDSNEGELQKVVGCGYPGQAEGVIVRIVHPETSELVPALHVGEVWVTSSSKALGYWNRPDLSFEDFQATIKTSTIHQRRANQLQQQPADPTKPSDDQASTDTIEATEPLQYLRTGDMGFMYKDELFICGRLKDMIIVGGSNHYPQDIERTLEQALCDYLRPGCSAAFAITAHTRGDSLNNQEHGERGTEDVVYVAELKDTCTSLSAAEYAELVAQCRAITASEHGLSLHTVCLLQTRSIPKTTSGKIARAWCRRALVDETLKIIYRSENQMSPISGHSNHHEPEATPTGYQAVQTKDDTTAPVSAAPVRTSQSTPAAAGLGPTLPAEELRQLSVPQIKTKVEAALIAVSQSGPSQLSAPINPSLSLVALGLDSMTIVQFKGILEHRFHCDVPDDFLFSPMATLLELTLAVQHGRLTAEQRQRYESGPGGSGSSDNAGGSGEGGELHGKGKAAAVAVGGGGGRRGGGMRQPLCPWFTCCY